MARTQKGKKKVHVRAYVREDTGTLVGRHYRSTPNPSGAKHMHQKKGWRTWFRK